MLAARVSPAPAFSQSGCTFPCLASWGNGSHGPTVTSNLLESGGFSAPEGHRSSGPKVTRSHNWDLL